MTDTLGKYAKLKRKVTDSVRRTINECARSISDEEVYTLIEDEIFSDASAAFIGASEISRMVTEIFCHLRCDMDILAPLTDDPDISEIMVNGPYAIFVERGGNVEKLDISFDCAEDLEDVIRRIAASVHREINELNPVLDARLENGSRVNAVYKNIALGGPALTIRKFPEKAFTMDDIVRFGTITEEAALFLKTMVRAGYNIFISGGTSSGKTTFLNALTRWIPEGRRTVVIEDSAELQLHGLTNVVRMECRNANAHGKGEVGMDDLIKASLRMRPDWLIVGEVRGAECASMLQAMNTGHYGLSTGHANSIEGMLRRMEAMYLQKSTFPIEAVREQISQGIDLIVHLGRISGYGRKVLEIAEIAGLRENKFEINTVFKYKLNEGLKPTYNLIRKREKLELADMKEEWYCDGD